MILIPSDIASHWDVDIRIAQMAKSRRTVSAASQRIRGPPRLSAIAAIAAFAPRDHPEAIGPKGTLCGAVTLLPCCKSPPLRTARINTQSVDISVSASRALCNAELVCKPCAIIYWLSSSSMPRCLVDMTESLIPRNHMCCRSARRTSMLVGGTTCLVDQVSHGKRSIFIIAALNECFHRIWLHVCQRLLEILEGELHSLSSFSSLRFVTLLLFFGCSGCTELVNWLGLHTPDLAEPSEAHTQCGELTCLMGANLLVLRNSKRGRLQVGPCRHIFSDIAIITGDAIRQQLIQLDSLSH